MSSLRGPYSRFEADTDLYLRTKLPTLQEESQLATLSRKADGLFIYAAMAVRYVNPPYRKMAKLEQLRLADKMLRNHTPPTSQKAVVPSLIDTLYQQILRAAFCELDKDTFDFDDRLKILHILLCTEERASTSVAGRLASDLVYGSAG